MKNSSFDITEQQEKDILKIVSFDADFFALISSRFPQLSSETHSLIFRMCKEYSSGVKETQETYRKVYQALIGEAPVEEILKVAK